MTLLEKFIQEQNDMNKMYQVCGVGKTELYQTQEILLQNYTKIGENHNPQNRAELQGEPKLLGLLGPMYNGIQYGKVVIRYETQELYKILSN